MCSQSIQRTLIVLILKVHLKSQISNLKFADTIEFHVCIPPRRGSPMPAQANGLGNGYTKTT